jgi:hypothetical protein
VVDASVLRSGTNSQVTALIVEAIVVDVVDDEMTSHRIVAHHVHDLAVHAQEKLRLHFGGRRSSAGLTGVCSPTR